MSAREVPINMEVFGPGTSILMRAGPEGQLVTQTYSSLYTLAQALVRQVDMSALLYGMGLTEEDDIPVDRLLATHAVLLRSLAESAREAAVVFDEVAERERERVSQAKDLTADVIARMVCRPAPKADPES